MSTTAGPRRPAGMVLLTAQTFTLGLLSAYIIIPASGLFLAAYGAGALPWVYLAVAVFAGLGTPLLTSALRARPLASVAVTVLGALAALIAGVWIGLEATGAAWLSVVLQIVFPLVLQVGFVFIGGQAGRLLTVREMKERFPTIVAGFGAGFLLAGLVAPLLLDALGATERLLALTSASALALVALVAETRRRYPAELRTRDEPPTIEADAPASGTARIGRAFVLALLGYQVLSALGTQLVDFLVYDRAAARYATSEELARFTSLFTVTLNAVDLVFLAVLAGRLMRRYGMKLGLMANPAVVGVLAVAALGGGAGAGIGSLAMFVAIGAARIADISLSDGTTRTAVGTAYQALPVHERVVAQARIEGLGVPVAIGLSGVLLLVLQRVLGGGTMAVASVTVAVCVLWTASGAQTYRAYRRLLRENLRRRVLAVDPADADEIAAPAAESLDAAALDTLLSAPGADPVAAAREVRRARAGAAAVDVLRRHLGHPDRDVGLAVVEALAGADLDSLDERRRLAAQALRGDVDHAARIAHALGLVGEDLRAGALADALADEARLVRRRALGALALVVPAGAVARGGAWLAGSDARLAAEALESLEVNAPPEVRAEATALLQLATDPAAAARRLASLRRERAARPADLDALLRELVTDPAGVWRRPWLAACALHTATSLGRPVAADLAQAALGSGDDVVAETARWAASRRAGVAAAGER